MKKILSIFIFISSFSALSQTGGQSVYSFLNVPVPARTAALAGNTLGLKDDDITLFNQNPAALNKGMNNQMALSYINYISDINFYHLAYAKSFDSIGHFGLSLQNTNYGKFKETDEYGAEIGTFRANDYNLNIAYARDLDSSLTWGINLKTIYSKYYNNSSLANAIDAGLTYKNKKRQFIISIVASNFGYQWKTYSGNAKEKLPFYFNAGLSKKLAKAPIRFLINYENLNRWDLTYSDPANPEPTVDPFTNEPIEKKKFRTIGDKAFRHLIFASEINISKNINFRIGYNYRRRKEMQLPDKGGLVGISFGFGVKISKFNFSYAFSKYHAGGNANHITLSTNLSSFIKN